MKLDRDEDSVSEETFDQHLRSHGGSYPLDIQWKFSENDAQTLNRMVIGPFASDQPFACRMLSERWRIAQHHSVRAK